METIGRFVERLKERGFEIKGSLPGGIYEAYEAVRGTYRIDPKIETERPTSQIVYIDGVVVWVRRGLPWWYKERDSPSEGDFDVTYFERYQSRLTPEQIVYIDSLTDADLERDPEIVRPYEEHIGQKHFEGRYVNGKPVDEETQKIEELLFDQIINPVIERGGTQINTSLI